MKQMSRQMLLRYAREAALLALEQYGIQEVEHLRFIRLSENMTYRVETARRERYLLRLNRNERLGTAEIESELVWLEFLAAAGITAPTGMRNRSGAYVTAVEMRGHGEQLCTLMTWVEGRSREDVGDQAVLACGELMGRLHRHAREFLPGPDFVRPVWGARAFREDFAALEPHYLNFMSEAEYVTFAKTADRISRQLELLQRDRESYGMIHGDLHPGNIVFLKGEPRPIDFGRCGFGYYLYDVAEALLGLASPQKKLFLEGYRSSCPLPEDCPPALEGFFLMACIENVCFHASVPEEREHLRRQTPYIVKWMERYLRGEPFL